MGLSALLIAIAVAALLFYPGPLCPDGPLTAAEAKHGLWGAECVTVGTPTLPPASRAAPQEAAEYKDTTPLGNPRLSEPDPPDFLFDEPLVFPNAWFGFFEDYCDSLWWDTSTDAFICAVQPRLSEPAATPFASQASFRTIGSAQAATPVEITLAAKRFAVGDTVRVAATITGLTDGLSGFDVTFEMPGGLAASNIQMPAYGLTQVTRDAGQVRLSAVDLFGVLDGSPGPFELFSFDLTGTDRGIHTIGLIAGAPLSLDDDSGGSLLSQATFTAGVYEVTELVQIDVKFVVTLLTTRTDAQIREAMLGIQATMKGKIDELLSTDDKTQRRPFEYRLKLARKGTLVQLYPDLILTVDTVRSNSVVRIRVLGLAAFLKTAFREAVAADPQTSIKSWHIHGALGVTDELEP